MSFFCQGLSLPAVPHLGVYNRQGYEIIESRVVSNTFSNPPKLLQREISLIDSPKVEYLTIVHDGRFFQGDFAEINLLFQPYIFFDAALGGNHECTIKLAVYLNESELVKAHISNFISDSLAIDPDDIYNCNVFTCIHPEDDFMCLSPNNAKLKFSLYIPVYVFFTLAMVPYKGEIVKVLATKHVFQTSSVNLTRILEIEEFLNQEFLFEYIEEVMERLGKHQGWLWYLHNVTWRVSGKPTIADFGGTEWDQMMQKYFEEQDPNAIEKLSIVLQTFITDIIVWGNIIESVIEWVN